MIWVRIDLFKKNELHIIKMLNNLFETIYSNGTNEKKNATSQYALQKIIKKKNSLFTANMTSHVIKSL